MRETEKKTQWVKVLATKNDNPHGTGRELTSQSSGHHVHAMEHRHQIIHIQKTG